VLQEHHRRLQSLSKRLFEIQEVERRQIALELHDQLGQMLTVVKLNLQAALRQKIKSKIKPYVVDSIATVEAVMRQVRDISLNLRPHILDNLGLLAALRWYVDRQAQQSGLIIRFTATNLETRPAPDIEIACFRVTQEALTNIIKHAGAREVLVELQQHDTELSLIIRDDGKGLDLPVALAGAARGETIGLSGMQERVELYGGRLEINSQPGRGAELCARFPLAPDSSP
jgi:signal transduction histidine kinase